MREYLLPGWPSTSATGLGIGSLGTKTVREGGFELPLYRLPPRFSCVAARNISQKVTKSKVVLEKGGAEYISGTAYEFDVAGPDRSFSLTWSAATQFFGTKESCYMKKDFNPLRICWYTIMTTVNRSHVKTIYSKVTMADTLCPFSSPEPLGLIYNEKLRALGTRMPSAGLTAFRTNSISY